MAQIVTVAGVAQVLWKPNWTLSLTSPDGLSLDADGKPHPLRVHLFHTISGAPQVGRQILLETTPSGRAGDKKILFTNAQGRGTFQVEDESDESVLYRASLMTASSIGDSLTIQWGGSNLFYSVSYGFGGPFNKDLDIDAQIGVNYVNPGDCSSTGDPVPPGTTFILSPGGISGIVGDTFTIPGPGVAGPVTYVATIDLPGSPSDNCSTGFDAAGNNTIGNSTVVGWA